MQFWNEMEGQVFAGLYPLRRLRRSEGRTAWFETDAGGGERAVISLTESLTDVDEVVARLEAAQRLRDPNLIAISAVGRARFEKTLFVYAVMEYTEQNLADVLREQPLSKEDVQQVAETLVEALTTIHQHGLLHGRVEPASVLSVGETVKLRSDCLQTPGSSRAGDVAGLGATLFQAFTQRKAEKADDGQINRLPAPFAEIVRNSLSARWSLGQVAAALRPPAAGSAAMPEPTQTSRAAVPLAPAQPSAPAKPAAAVPAPVIPAPPPPPTPAPSFSKRTSHMEDEDDTVSRSSRSVAVYIILAVVLLVVAAWLVFRPQHSRTSSMAANPAMTPRTSGVQAPVVPPSQESDSPAKPSAVHSAPAPAVTPVPAGDGTSAAVGRRPVWRVIAFTYDRQDQAQRKMEEISQEHAGLQPSVVSLSAGGRPRFLVAVGGPMSRSQALALRDKAAAMGLPADTYVQNFSK